MNWHRWIRAGAFWFASDNWLKSQPPRFDFSVGQKGVIDISFSSDSRRGAAECTVTALAKRWSVLPGDVVRVSNQGPADGHWIVQGTRRTLTDESTEITLARAAPKLPEPAPEQTQKTINVGGKSAGPAMSDINVGNAPEKAARVYYFATIMTRWNLPYSKLHRTLVDHPHDADCSSGVSWVLWKAGLLPASYAGKWAPIYIPGSYTWGVPGYGKYFTQMWSYEHVWLRFNGMGKAWRFDTSSWGDSYTASSGGRLRYTPRSIATFHPRHWPGL